MGVRKLSIAFVLVVGLAGNLSARATEIFYGVRGSWGVDNPADLITIDPVTGGLDRVIGLTGLSGVGGFAVNPVNGKLYAAGGGDGTAGLHTLDRNTGAATFVGGGVTVKDMGFNSSGVLYAVMAGFGTGVNGELATIDLATGAVSSIGGAFLGGVGMAFDSTDTLYVKTNNTLYTVDPFTAAILSTTLLDRRLYNHLAIDAADTLYSTALWDSQPDSQIYTIDPTTGITTALPSAVPFLNPEVGISAFDFAAVPVPATLSLVGLGVAGIGFLRRRKSVGPFSPAIG